MSPLFLISYSSVKGFFDKFEKYRQKSNKQWNMSDDDLSPEVFLFFSNLIFQIYDFIEESENLNESSDQKNSWEELEFKDIQQNTPIKPIFQKIMMKYKTLVNDMEISEYFADYENYSVEIMRQERNIENLSDEDSNLSIPELLLKYTDPEVTSYSLEKLIPLQRLRPIKLFYFFCLHFTLLGLIFYLKSMHCHNLDGIRRRRSLFLPFLIQIM